MSETTIFAAELLDIKTSCEKHLREAQQKTERDLMELKAKYEEQLAMERHTIKQLSKGPSQEQVDQMMVQHQAKTSALELRLLELQQQNQALTKELHKTKSELEQTQCDLEESSTQYEQLTAAFRELQHTSKQHIAALKSECSLAEEQAQNAELELQSVQNQLEQALADYETMKAKVVEHEQTIAAMKNLVEHAEDAAKKNQKKLEQVLTAEHSRRHDTERALQEARTRVQSLEKELTVNTIKISASRDESIQLREQVVHLEHELGTLKLKRQQELKDYKTSISQLEQSSKDSVAAIEQQLRNEMAKQQEEARCNIQKLNNELFATAQDLKTEKAERIKLDAKLRECTAKLDQTMLHESKTLNTIKAQLKAESEAKARLQEELIKVRTHLENELAKEKQHRAQLEKEVSREQEARKRAERELFIERDAIDHEFKEVTKRSEEALTNEWEVLTTSVMHH